MARCFCDHRPLPDVPLNKRPSSHLAKLLATMVQAGRGMAWLPESLIADQLASGELVKAGGAGWEIPIDIHVFRPRSRLTPAAEAFWKHVQEHPRPSTARKPVRSRRGRG
ncbi:LysR substrate-binding domain-containing protein [Bradyrhizobium sp. USDA 3311]